MGVGSFSGLVGRLLKARAAGRALPRRAVLTPRDFWERVDPAPVRRGEHAK